MVGGGRGLALFRPRVTVAKVTGADAVPSLGKAESLRVAMGGLGTKRTDLVRPGGGGGLVQYVEEKRRKQLSWDSSKPTVGSKP